MGGTRMTVLASSVEFIDVRKSYDDVEVVKGVSLAVEGGEFLVLVGPSGCGKSTCLRMIAGLEEVSSGQVKIAERVVNDVAPKDRDIGMVFQSYALYPHLSVYENIAFGLSLRKVDKNKIRRRVDEVSKILGLEELLQRKPKALSGGQRQRVAMGRAIARQPSVFLFDEPLSNLDAALRVQMRGELAALHRRLGTTMIYVTHDQVEAMTLANRIAVLNQGYLQQCGTPMELYQQPANRFVAQFIGSPSMNVLDGQLDIDGGSAVFRSLGVTLQLAGFDTERIGKAVAIGVRPQYLVTAAEGPIRGEVEVVEAMGWEAFAHVRGEFGRIVARLEGEDVARVKPGETVALDVLPEHLHFFGDDGAAL